MKLYVKSIDAPLNCMTCIYQEYDEDGFSCCRIDGAYAEPNERRKDCPVSDIPTPHGDLIDRDDLLAYFERKAKGKTAEEALKLLYTALKAYPTIIEKEMNQ